MSKPRLPLRVLRFVLKPRMVRIKPFAALRPRPELAGKICELPYDVMSSEEARAIAAGSPLSFLHVSKPEIDLPPATDIYSPAVYTKGKENLDRLVNEGSLFIDSAPRFYLYRQVMGTHSQTGLVAVASCEDYLAGIIKKHELTRPDKEDDRVRHIETLNAQTGPVFLVYQAQPEIDRIVAERISQAPEVDFTAADGVRHSAWSIGEEAAAKIKQTFEALPAAYIADGHHRSAAAGRVFQARKGRGNSGWFLSVIFPHNQVKILPYNRVLKDLNGQTPDRLRKALEQVFEVLPGAGSELNSKHEVGFFFEGKWQKLRFRSELTHAVRAVDRLDATLLQQHVLEPLFGIDNPRTSKRVNFVGGIRGLGELEKLVSGGEYTCAFAMFPTGIEDLMSIADAGEIMPPKSTWFEPKLRDAMFSHVL